MPECCKRRHVMFVAALGGRTRTVDMLWSDGRLHEPCKKCDAWMEEEDDDAL